MNAIRAWVPRLVITGLVAAASLAIPLSSDPAGHWPVYQAAQAKGEGGAGGGGGEGGGGYDENSYYRPPFNRNYDQAGRKPVVERGCGLDTRAEAGAADDRCDRPTGEATRQATVPAQ